MMNLDRSTIISPQGFDFANDSRSDRATREAHLRDVERRLRRVSDQLAAVPAELPLAEPTGEWAERALTVLCAFGATAAPAMVARDGHGAAVAGCLLAGLLSAVVSSLASERARRMATGEVLYSEWHSTFPGATWWLVAGLLSGLLGWALADADAPWWRTLIWGASAAIGTATAAWWGTTRWHRHAVARLRHAEVEDLRDTLLREQIELQAEYTRWHNQPCYIGFAHDATRAGRQADPGGDTAIALA